MNKVEKKILCLIIVWAIVMVLSVIVLTKGWIKLAKTIDQKGIVEEVWEGENK